MDINWSVMLDMAILPVAIPLAVIAAIFGIQVIIRQIVDGKK